MLRRLTSCLTVITLLAVSLAPLASTASATPAQKGGKRQQRRQSKLAPEFEGAAARSNGNVRVIVQTKGRPGAAHDEAIASKGGTKRQTFDALNAFVAELPASEVASLAARADVEYVSPDRTVHAQMDVTRETTGAALAQAGTTGDNHTNGLTGKGVTIAVLDSGIDASHPDFQRNQQTRVLTALDFTRSGDGVNGDGLLISDGIMVSDGDPYGHGTGVAGVAAGSGAASAGYAGNYAGIAPEANLVDLKVLGADGTGTTSATLGALNWAISNQKRFNIRVLNMSLGTSVRESYRTDPLTRAVARAVSSGIVVVCSAGNNGRTDEIVGHDADGEPIYRKVYGAINSPGNSPYAITVGATDSHTTARHSDDTVAQFSSKGPTQFDRLPKPDLVAPGRRLVAALSQENPTLAAEHADRVVQPTNAGAAQNLYFKYSGTSFSAPVVSGVVALMLEANRSLTPVLTKAVLLRTANALPSSLFHSKTENLLSQGAGQVNAAAATEMARAIVPNADKLKAGAQIFRPGVTLQSLRDSVQIGGESVAQTARVLYSNGVTFADRPVLTNGIALGDGLLISDGLILSDGFVLGDGILISDGIMVSDGVVMGDGLLVSDGILISDGFVLGDGIMISDGILISDGIMISDGLLISDGLVMSDGLLVSDGVMVSDGIMISDGIIVTD